MNLTRAAYLGETPPVSSPLTYLREILIQRLDVLEARRHRFVAGWHEAPAWINSSRLIFVEDGHLDYTLSGQTLSLRAGAAVLVPVDAERSWNVPTQSHCDLAWFRYACPDGDEPTLPGGLHCEDAGVHTARRRVRTLINLLGDPTPARQLVAEAEAKLLLAHFLHKATPIAAEDDPGPLESRGDLAVNRAVLWLNQHYADRDALVGMQDRLDISVAHFRRLFKQQMGCSPRDYLTRRRMQVARYELYHRDDQVKQVADRVGYDDPLYFSRIYAAFWGHPPTLDQHRRWENKV